MSALTPRRSITIAAVGALVAAPLLAGGVAVAGTEPDGGADSADTALAEAGITAFETLMVDNGYESNGPGAEGDILGIGETDEAVDEEPAAACIAPVADTIADDGTFVGEIARATSDDFALAAPPSSDLTMVAGGTVFNAVVVIGDESGVESFDRIIERFASEELSDCMSEALDLATAGSDVPEGLSIDYHFGSVDLGDGGADVSASSTVTYDGETMQFGFSSTMVRSGNTFVIVSAEYDGDATDLSPSPQDAASAILDAMG